MNDEIAVMMARLVIEGCKRRSDDTLRLHYTLSHLTRLSLKGDRVLYAMATADHDGLHLLNRPEAFACNPAHGAWQYDHILLVMHGQAGPRDRLCLQQFCLPLQWQAWLRIVGGVTCGEHEPELDLAPQAAPDLPVGEWPGLPATLIELAEPPLVTLPVGTLPQGLTSYLLSRGVPSVMAYGTPLGTFAYGLDQQDTHRLLGDGECVPQIPRRVGLPPMAAYQIPSRRMWWANPRLAGSPAWAGILKATRKDLR